MKLAFELGAIGLPSLAKAIGAPSLVTLRRRTTALCQNGYLIYPPIQDGVFGRRKGAGSRPAVIQLGQRGAEYLRDRFGYSLNSSNWDTNARRKKIGAQRAHMQFEHDVLANDVLISLREAYKGREGFTVLSAGEVIEQSPVATREMRTSPFSMPVRFVWPLDNTLHERHVKPDGVFAYRTGGENPQTWLVFVEFDMKTESVARGVRGGKDAADRTSIWQKIAMYNSLISAKRGHHLLRQRFGIDHFQVMFVSRASTVQLGNMVEASAEFHRLSGSQPPKGRFFFTTLDQFNLVSNPLDKIWWNSAGGCRGFL